MEMWSYAPRLRFAAAYLSVAASRAALSYRTRRIAPDVTSVPGLHSSGSVRSHFLVRVNEILLRFVRIKPSGSFQFRQTSEIMDPFRLSGGLLRQKMNPSEGFYLHKTEQHKNSQKNIPASSGIHTHVPGVRAVKTHASNRAATEHQRDTLFR
jgi:hypothetical protein